MAETTSPRARTREQLVGDVEYITGQIREEMGKEKPAKNRLLMLRLALAETVRRLDVEIQREEASS